MFLASFVSALCLYRAVIALGPVATSAVPPQLAHQDRRYFVLAAHPLVTDGPRIDEHILLERQAVTTCGYVSGNGGMQIHRHLLWSTRSGCAANTLTISASPLTCPSGYSCTSTIQDLVQWACCNQIECQGNYRTCVNEGDNFCDGLDPASCSSIYISILSWWAPLVHQVLPYAYRFLAHPMHLHVLPSQDLQVWVPYLHIIR
jgi:hypothetical protein